MDNTGTGAIIVDGVVVAETRQCCHCGGHFQYVRGSGTKRGFCMKCMAMTCGCQKCMECLPEEKMLDLYEKGQLLRL
jgi:hypothetical protein